MSTLSRLAALFVALLILSVVSPATAVPDRDAGDTTANNSGKGSGKHKPTPKAPAKPGVPEWVSVPAAGVNAPVQSVTRRRGVLAIPANPRSTGWDTSTARPGARMGTTLIAGHRDTGSGQTGALRWIGSLDRGDTIRVSTTTGTVTYRVTSVVNYRKRGLPASVVNPVGWHRLALVTCGGPLIKVLDADGKYRLHYRDNIVVWAKPVR